MIEAWLSSSEITASSGPSIVAQRPSFAFQQDTYESEASVPTKSASACSNSRWMVKVPHMKRTLAVPAPNRSSAWAPPAMTSGSAESPR